MSFEPTNMRQVAPHDFSYQTPDSLADVAGSAYFKRFVGGYQFFVGDTISVQSTADEVSDVFTVAGLNSAGDATAEPINATAGPFGASWGAVAEVAGLSCDVIQMGRNMARLDFTLDQVELAVTDAAGSGSSASLKLFDLAAFAFVVLGCRQKYTAFEEGAALTGGAGDAAFVMGVGIAAANAGDAALTGDEVAYGDVTATITLVGGAGSGGKVSGARTAAQDGQDTAKDVILNWSGSAASIDANSTIKVSGEVSILLGRL